MLHPDRPAEDLVEVGLIGRRNQVRQRRGLKFIAVNRPIVGWMSAASNLGWVSADWPRTRHVVNRVPRMDRFKRRAPPFKDMTNARARTCGLSRPNRDLFL